ncbi:MAG: glycerol-3-phosphate responsive antiterminator [Fusobacteriaceae bacterium]|nr:glycerol-3-phosphate responsive antiterminator [Fusobacteriaceae bacterium]
MNINEILSTNKIIGATKLENIELAVNSKVSAIVIMNLKLNQIINSDISFYNKKKPIFIHFDLIKGLSSDNEGIKFLKENLDFTGIVSTKSSVIRSAKKEGILTIQRVFLIDTQSFENSIENIIENNPDAVEIMPGIAPEIVKMYKERIKNPIILGGLINEKKHIENAIQFGADGISLSNNKFWNI